MAGYDSGKYVPKPVYRVGGGYSNVANPQGSQVFNVPGTKSFSNVANPVFGNITGTGVNQRSAGAPSITDLTKLVSGAASADAQDRRDGRGIGGDTAPQSDPYLDMLYGLMGQAGQGSGPNLSGFNNVLAELESEKTRVSDRYKKYTGQIADIYGTLTGITQADIANIAPRGEALRAGLSAQEAERTAATRATEDARLATATQARAELGLEDLAGQYAGGDIVTQQAEGSISDSEAQRSAAENTLLANEAIAQQAGQNRITGYGLQQQESAAQLQTSLEDALAAIRAQQAQIEMQKSQAASSGSGPNINAQLAILDKIQAYSNPEALGEPTPLDIFESRNPGLGTTGRTAADTFAEWISNTANYDAIPAVRKGEKPSASQVVGAFLTQVGQTVPQAQNWARNSSVFNLLVDLANTAE
jgi:hypothetical protein